MRLSLALIIVYLYGLLLLGASGPRERTYEGKYRNNTYAYEVTLPRGVIARGSAAPNPNHGFTVDLRVANRTGLVYGGTDLFISVDASYTPEDDVQTLADAVNFTIRMTEQSAGTKLRIESQRETSLGGLKAVRVVSSFEVHGASIIDEDVVALGGFMYTARVRTTPKRRASDVKLLDQVLSGFRVLPPRR